MPALSVIIVSYKVRYYIEQCICSVRRSMPDAQVIVVDNNSGDGSVEFLTSRFPDVTVIANPENSGFGKANNMALEMAQGRYVLFLNPDTVVAERTLPECIAFMDENPEVGCVGVRMQYGDGRFARESRRSLPTPSVSFWHMTGMGRLFPHSRLFAKYHLTYYDQDIPCRIEVTSGAFMMARREALDKTGGFDESFFMYGEDIDLSYRILKEDYDNWYLPVPIVHYKGESTNKTSYRYAKVFYDAMQIFFDKHFHGYSVFFSGVVRIVLAFRKIATFLSQNVKKHTAQEYHEKCLFVGNSENFDKAAAKIEASRILVEPQYIDCSDFESVNTAFTEGGYQALLFDASAFKLDDVLDYMYGCAQAGVRRTMGLYWPENDRLVTEDEVL